MSDSLQNATARSGSLAAGSASRAIAILVALIDSPDVGVSELSREFGWTKSATHRVSRRSSDVLASSGRGSRNRFSRKPVGCKIRVPSTSSA